MNLRRQRASLVQAHHDFDPQRLLAADNRTPPRYAWFLGSQLDEPGAVLLVAEDDAGKGARTGGLARAARREAQRVTLPS